MSYISIHEVVARAKMQLGLSSSAQDLNFQVYAEEALRNLRCLSTYTEKGPEKVPILDGKAKLPCGFYKFIGVRPYDASGCLCTDTVYVDYSLLRDRCCSLTSNSVNHCSCEELFKIIGGYIHMHMPTDATELELVWMGLNTDPEGMMYIEERYERGVANYIMWMYAIQPRSGISKDLRDNYYSIWDAQKSMLAGDDTKRQWDLEKIWIMEANLNQTAAFLNPRF